MGSLTLDQWILLSNQGISIATKLFMHFKSQGKTDGEALTLIDAHAKTLISDIDISLMKGHEKDGLPVPVPPSAEKPSEVS